MIERLRASLRWLRVPFAEVTLALALIGAAAVPAFLVAAAALWEEAAGDELTRRVVADATGDPGLRISTEALFFPEPLATADQEVRAAFGRIEELAPPVLSLLTPRGWGLVGPEQQVAPVQVRLLARPGAIEALEVVAERQSATGGVWISDWLAARADISLGDRLLYSSTLEPEEPAADAAPAGGPTSEFTVIGIYRALWNELGDPPPAYWQDVPDGIVPSYIGPFQLPSFALLVVDEVAIANTGVSGTAEWRARLPAAPKTRIELDRLASQYAGLSAALTVDPELAAALGALTPEATPPSFDSGLLATATEVATLTQRLDQPIGSVQAAGIAVGIAVMIASGLLAVERRRSEFRLLAGEGDRWGRFTARAVAQLLLPATAGALAGVLLAAGVAAITFNTWPGLGAVEVRPVLLVTIIGIGAAALTTGFAGQAVLGSGRMGPRRALWPSALALVVIARFLWIQVGRSRPAGSATVDLTVAALPIVALLAAVMSMLVILEAVAQRSRKNRGSLPAVPLLAWRRVTAESLGARMIVGALGVGIGLVVFATILVATLARSVDVKSAVTVGAETSIELLAHPTADIELPPRTTVIAVQTTRTTPGDGNVTMVAIDPGSFADAVTWPAEMGGSPQQLLDFLATDIGFNLPVAGISGQQVPVIGGFGTFQSSPFQIVARFSSLPLASDRSPTLVVSAKRLDRFELERIAPGLDLDPDDPEVEAMFVSPVEKYRPYLVSQAEPAELEAFLESSELVAREIITRDGIRGAVDTVGARFAFDYLRLLGLVGAVASGASLALYLSARRRGRALAQVMTRRMGLTRHRAALVTTLEVAVLSAAAAVTAALLAPRVTQRLIPRFDPTPDVPPQLGVEIPAAAPVALVVGIAAVVAIVWAFEWRAGRVAAGKVLRELN